MADHEKAPTGNINIERGEPPPGSVSAFRLSDDAINAVSAVADRARSVLPTPPEIPAWVFFAGAAVCGSIAYAAWRALKVTAPVLVPIALGVPPTTAFAMQQIAARKPHAFGLEESAPATELMSRPPSGAVPNTIPGIPLSAENLAAILALAPALGIPSGTAAALETIAATLGQTAAAAPTHPRPSAPAAAKTMVSAT